MASNVASTDKSKYLTINLLAEEISPRGIRLTYPYDARVCGSDITGIDPRTVLVSVGDLVQNRGWEYQWPKKFGLASISVTMRLDPGLTQADYVVLADVFAAEATPEWETINAERDAKRLRHEEEMRVHEAKLAAHNRDLALLHNHDPKNGAYSPSTPADKANALRNIAAYLQDRVDSGRTLWTSSVAEYIGICPSVVRMRPKHDKALTALVASGKLSRRRGTGWEYNTASVQAYIIQLAEQIDAQETV